jgi:hypothetical protein
MKRQATRSATEIKMQEIARWQSLDKSIDEIAILMNMTADGITQIVRKPDYRLIRQALTSATFAEVDQRIKERKADVMLHEASADAASMLIDLLNRKEQVVTESGAIVEADPSIRDLRMVSTAILDRAGYGPIQRKTIKAKIEMDPVLAKILKAALDESAIEAAIDVTPLSVTSSHDE